MEFRSELNRDRSRFRRAKGARRSGVLHKGAPRVTRSGLHRPISVPRGAHVPRPPHRFAAVYDMTLPHTLPPAPALRQHRGRVALPSALTTSTGSTLERVKVRERDAAWPKVAPHRDALIAFLQRHCRDEHLAEDLAHDALVRAVRHAESIGRVRCLGAWLQQIAANAHRDHLRRESRYSDTTVASDSLLALTSREPSPAESSRDQPVFFVAEQHISADELFEEVGAVLPALPERDRRMLSAYYLRGDSLQETAQRNRVTPDLVKVWLFRARRRLEAAVEMRLARRAHPRAGEGVGVCAASEPGSSPAHTPALSHIIPTGSNR